MIFLLKSYGILSAKRYSLSLYRHSTKVKKLAKDFALQHFDQFYGSSFKNWPSIRLGLLCPHSYCAVINVFSDTEKTCEVLEELGAYDMKTVYSEKLGQYVGEITNSSSCFDFQKTTTDYLNLSRCDVFMSEQSFSDNQTKNESSGKPEVGFIVNEASFVPASKFKYRDDDINEGNYAKFYDSGIDAEISTSKEKLIHYPESWKIYFSPRGKFKEFPPPKKDVTGLLNYYLMDGASILPPLALDVQPEESVGDFCASPGGKTLAILFGLQFGKLLCNDVSLSRLNKLKTVLSSYVPCIDDWNKKILVSNINVCLWHHVEAFDKILLDVPCTNDRLSATTDGNNIFKQSRFQERMKLPEVQTEMLSTALQGLKPGGSLVYSTCTLSPIQNDGVVYMALSRLHRNTSMQFIVKDLSDTFYPLRQIFCFSDTCQYGQLVLPFLPLNYGPMYICKIHREK